MMIGILYSGLVSLMTAVSNCWWLRWLKLLVSKMVASLIVGVLDGYSPE